MPAKFANYNFSRILIKMASLTATGLFVFTLPFVFIAAHSIKEYLKDRDSNKKKHLCYAFVIITTSFIVDLIGALMISPVMEPTTCFIVKTLLKSFDFINMIAVFWFFIFLTDFIDDMKRYIPFVAFHLLLTLAVIAVMPFDVVIFEGNEFIEDRHIITIAAIFIFWFLYWSIIAYQFWDLSKFMTSKVAITKSQMMSAAAVFAILAYLSTIIAALSQIITINFVGQVFAIASGVFLYLGFVAPKRLQGWLEK